MNDPAPDQTASSCLGIPTLVDFLKGNSDRASRARAAAHISHCRACRDVLSSLARSSAISDTLPAASDFAVDPVEDALAPGTQVGRYVIDEQIGAGAMGVVYAAHDPELARVVAVKVLRGGDGRLQDRLRREAQAMARLAHPHVVAVYDVGVLDDRVFVAMEYVAGDTLARWLATPRSRREILQVYRDAGSGLAAAHRAGIVHRDFKPENVLVGDDGRVRVGDFGLARTGSAESPGDAATGAGSAIALSSSLVSTMPVGLTASAAILGTPYYMAPELYDGREADARSDQFSFCVALFTALYGRRPFEGDTVIALHDNLSAGRIREPGPLRGVSRRNRAALRRGLAIDPAKRFASMADLLVQLAPRHRQRLAWSVAAGALAVSAWLLVRPAGTPTDARCTGAPAAFGAVWSAERRSAIDAAFTRSGAPYAAAALSQVTGALDRYAARWIAAHTEACRATQILGEQTEATLDLRMACLDRRRQEASALVAELTAGDAAVVARSVTAAVGLVDVATCGDLTALRQLVPPPPDPATRATLSVLGQRLADARAKYEIGAFGEALALTRAVAADAHQLAYRPFEAETQLLQGQLEYETGDMAHAETTLQAAVWSAEAGRHDEVAARAWSSLVFLIGYEKAEYARGLALVPRATAAIERLGGSADVTATLERALGAIDGDQSKLDTAVAHFETSLALTERVFGTEHPRVARSLDNLGMTVLAQGNSARAVSLHERALHLYEALLGSQHPTTAQALHNLGNAHAAAGNHSLAEQEIRRALAVREAALPAGHPDIAASLTDLARVIRMQGRAADALAIDRRAVPAGEKAFGADHPVFANQLVGFGIDLGRVGRHAEADEQLTRAEAILAKQYGPAHVEVLNVRAARGDLLMRQARWREAKALYEQILPALSTSQGASSLPSVQSNLARALVELHQPAHALPSLEQLARNLDALPPRARADIQLTLARALWDSGGDRVRARALGEDALRTLAPTSSTAAVEITQIERWLASHRPH